MGSGRTRPLRNQADHTPCQLPLRRSSLHRSGGQQLATSSFHFWTSSKYVKRNYRAHVRCIIIINCERKKGSFHQQRKCISCECELMNHYRNPEYVSKAKLVRDKRGKFFLDASMNFSLKSTLRSNSNKEAYYAQNQNFKM